MVSLKELDAEDAVEYVKEIQESEGVSALIYVTE